MAALRLPPRALVPRSHDGDPIDYYYRPLTAWLYRTRLRHALALLGRGPYDALLEVGYGSGVLLPELAARSRRLAAVDVHGGREAVAAMASTLGIAVELHDASLYEMPFEDGAFDALVCLSVLEHLRDLDAALAELARVVRPGGVLIVGVPVRNRATSAFFRLVGHDPLEIHPSSHRDVEAAVGRCRALAFERRSTFPHVLPVDLAAYATSRCRRR